MISSHVIEILGLTVNSTVMELSLPLLKIKQIQAEVRKLMRVKTISARNLPQLLGKMNAMVCIIPTPLSSIAICRWLYPTHRKGATRTTRL